MKARSKKGNKGKTGKDGKTKQQRYLERNRAKVNAANNKRNKEARKKKKLPQNKGPPAEDGAAFDAFPPKAKTDETYSDDSNFDIATALALPRSDGPLPCSDPPSPFEESDDDLSSFEQLSSRFVTWSNLVDETVKLFGRYWNARQGWKPEQPFTLTNFESKFYLYSLQAKGILHSARSVLQSQAAGGQEWEEVLDMIEYLSSVDSFLNMVRTSWKETEAADDRY